jgi:hypothetical protein
MCYDFVSEVRIVEIGMQLRVALIIFSLLASGSFLAACSGGGGSEDGLYYAPPVNYNPRAGLNPNLSEGFITTGPSSPPFQP